MFNIFKKSAKETTSVIFEEDLSKKHEAIKEILLETGTDLDFIETLLSENEFSVEEQLILTNIQRILKRLMQVNQVQTILNNMYRIASTVKK